MTIADIHKELKEIHKVSDRKIINNKSREHASNLLRLHRLQYSVGSGAADELVESEENVIDGAARRVLVERGQHNGEGGDEGGDEDITAFAPELIFYIKSHIGSKTKYRKLCIFYDFFDFF